MRLLHVISSVDPRAGGPVRWIHSLHRELRRRGHTSSILTFDSPDAGFLQDVEAPLIAAGPAMGFYSLCPRAIALIREQAREVDAVVVEGLWQFQGLATKAALRSLDVPYLVFPHGMLDPWFKNYYPLKHLKKSAYWHLVERQVLAKASSVVFTNAEEARLARLSFRRSDWHEEIVRFGIEDVPADGESLRLKFLEEHPELMGKRLLLFLGRLHEKKGYDILLKAFASTCESDPRLHLLLAGPSDEQVSRQIEQIIEQAGLGRRVNRLDFVSGASKWGALYAAELFCLPSHQENFGIAVAESLACGIPVLVSDKVNIHDEISRANAGVVGSDTVSGTVASLRRWLGYTEDQRLAMRTAARDCFRLKFHISYAVDDLLRITTSSIGQPRPAGVPMQASSAD
jgi:glycosyltransferase involved in cell wall biosynthesis